MALSLLWKRRFARYGPAMVLACAVVSTLILSTANLSGPSLWHDELVHVFVARSILENGLPQLPSGMLYENANLYNYALAGFVWLFGHGEAAVRLPAALFGALSTALTFLVLRPLLGKGPALLAAVLLAWSPWQIAWARQARFYTLQQTAYLLLLGLGWRLATLRSRKRHSPSLAGLALVFAGATQASLHSLTFLGSPGLFYGIEFLRTRRRRWFVLGALTVLLTVFAVGGHWFFLPQHDRDVMVQASTGPGASYFWDIRTWHYYYFDWFGRNMGWLTLVLLLLGTVGAIAQRRRAGLYAVLAAWLPLLVFSLVFDYRRARFIFFAWPFLVGLIAYGACWLAVQAFRRWRPGFAVAWRIAAVVLLARAAWTGALLAGDCIETASGADITLARRHPRWREPCRYVRERLTADTAVIATTSLPVYYYVGRVDEWFPAKNMWWEDWELGLEGLEDTDALRAFIARHPKGCFLAEHRRFDYPAALREEVVWVRKNLELIEEASNEDVRVYVWGDALR